ncbi:MAG: hypothetical protein AAFY57_09040 [Cyanobacteria bacterium J06642_2]
MKIRYACGIGLLALAGLVLVTLVWHNRSMQVGLVWLGRDVQAMSLGGAIARAFGVGAIVGVPLVGSWWATDWWQQRRSRRFALRWIEKVEGQTYSPLPAAIAEPYSANREVGDYATSSSDWTSDSATWPESEADEGDWET